MMSKEFWEAESSTKKKLSKSASAPDVRKQKKKDKKKGTTALESSKKAAGPKGVDKVKLAWGSGTFPGESDSIREEDFDYPMADPSPEPEPQHPTFKEYSVQVEAEPLS